MAVSRAVHAAVGMWGRRWGGMVGGQETCLEAQQGAALRHGSQSHATKG